MLAPNKLTLERTEDFELLSKIINTPPIPAELGIVKDYDVEWINRTSEGCIWFLCKIDDIPVGFLWCDIYEGDYLGHVMMLPPGRGINVVKFIDATATWMFLNTKCKVLWAKPPFLKSYRMIKLCGFEDVEIRFEQCPFTKKVWKRWVTVLTRERWEAIQRGEVVI